MLDKEQVLVAIVNNQTDFSILKDKGWYRIPVINANKWLENRWPPEWLAFYQTKIFGPEAYSITYYARVNEIRKVSRHTLFPDETPNEKTRRMYYQLFTEPLQKLPSPIISSRLRRIVFIPTTWNKFIHASEVNDLFDFSPIEDQMWKALKVNKIPAERNEFVYVRLNYYQLDFVIYCKTGNINVETDGDNWHFNPVRARQDMIRDNYLSSKGWTLLRFNSLQINTQMEKYCMPMINDTILKLEGIRWGIINY